MNKLTTDDVRDLIERHSDAAGGNGRDFHNGAYKAIADELNAAMGGGECERVKRGTKPDGTPRYRCSVCGYGLGDYRWAYCPKCGRKVVDE